MKIDLSTINRDQFMVHPHEIGGHKVWLVQPVHIGCEWSADNMIFRSSVWDDDGNLVSASYKKFFNWGEKPHLCPPPTNLTGSNLMEKLDGSTLIFSRWRGNTIIRTRGTVDARLQANGHEIDFLCQKYEKFMHGLESDHTVQVSYVFEWTSPSNQIIINYGYEPDMILTNIICHRTYDYFTQNEVDMAAEFFGLRRPKVFSYDSVEQMRQSVTDFKGMEGLCVYFHDDQEILKVKGAQYLYLHRAKSEISSIEKVMDVYFDLHFSDPVGDFPTYQEFFSYLETTFDYEIAHLAIGHISRICDGMKEVKNILDGMHRFIDGIKSLPTRRDQAQRVLQAYGDTGRSSMLFNLLDGKPLKVDDLKKLLFQVLK